MSTLLSHEDFRILADEMEGRPAEEVLAWAADRFAGGIVLTCSWQMQSSVLVDMASRVGADLRIVELDTGLLFPETYETRDRLIERYGLEVERIAPERTVAEQEADEGPELWRRDPDRCCGLRKVAPLRHALAGMDAWVTGIRRAQSPGRLTARKVDLDESRGVVKIQPLVELDGRGRPRLPLRPRRPLQPTARPRVPLDRLHAVHARRRAGGGPPRRPLGAQRQDRVRAARARPGDRRLRHDDRGRGPEGGLSESE